jgi:hypothetical protein
VLILFDVEHESAAAAVAGHLRCDSHVVPHDGPRVVVEPVDVAGRHVDSQESFRETPERSRPEIGHGSIEFLAFKPPAAPHFPHEVAPACRIDVEYDAVKREPLHVVEMRPHKSRVGFVPAPLDELLLLRAEGLISRL